MSMGCEEMGNRASRYLPHLGKLGDQRSALQARVFFMKGLRFLQFRI